MDPSSRFSPARRFPTGPRSRSRRVPRRFSRRAAQARSAWRSNRRLAGVQATFAAHEGLDDDRACSRGIGGLDTCSCRRTLDRHRAGQGQDRLRPCRSRRSRRDRRNHTKIASLGVVVRCPASGIPTPMRTGRATWLCRPALRGPGSRENRFGLAARAAFSPRSRQCAAAGRANASGCAGSARRPSGWRRCAPCRARGSA